METTVYVDWLRGMQVAAEELAQKLKGTEYHDDADRLAEELAEKLQNATIRGVVRPAPTSQEVPRNKPQTATSAPAEADWDAWSEGRLTLRVKRGTLLRLFAGGNVTLMGKPVSYSLGKNLLEHFAWLTRRLSYSEDGDTQDFFGAQQLTAAQELLEAVEEAEKGGAA